MSDAILVLNAGSSSLKFSVFAFGEPPQQLVRGQIEGLFTQPRFRVQDLDGRPLAERSWEKGTQLGHAGAVEFLLEWGRTGPMSDHRILAAGHRVVHGGLLYSQPMRITPEVFATLQQFVPLAPLHQPHNLTVLGILAQRAPDLPQFGCFDTAFHRTQPPVAQIYGLPKRFQDEGVLKYGFHGLSYEYIATALPTIDATAAQGKTVVAHLGNGASMCALLRGQSVATTMGFTPLDGLVMGTRCGTLDPGILLYLMDHHQFGPRELEKLLYHQSGLIGVSGISSDMRTLLSSDAAGAREALDLFVYRIQREIGSLAAALEGIDALVFTGGIGENSAEIRERIMHRMAWLGADIDPHANREGGPRISPPGSRVSVWVIPTNEERMIAQHSQRLFRESR